MNNKARSSYFPLRSYDQKRCKFKVFLLKLSEQYYYKIYYEAGNKELAAVFRLFAWLKKRHYDRRKKVENTPNPWVILYLFRPINIL